MGSPKRIVICGGGAIGAAIAYFVSLRGASPIVIERHEVGGAASGKSGGFLALDWCQGSPLDRLARRSFALHAQLSSDLGDPWGYRRLTTYSGYAAADDTARGKGGRPWLSAGITITGQLGSAASTAVIEPRGFTTGLMHAARVCGAVLRNSTVVDLVRWESGAVRGVALAGGEIVEGDAVVIAMGPWSILAARWLPLPAVLGYKGHSPVFETGGAIPAEALFLEYREASGEILTGPPSSPIRVRQWRHINGRASAGGLITALGCDNRIASEGALEFSLNEVPIGISHQACGGSAPRRLN
jgi:glycine/D-amino acid oxidase-like deaminating enzyme